MQVLLHGCWDPAQQVCFHRSSTRCWHRLLAVDASLCRVVCFFFVVPALFLQVNLLHPWKPDSVR